jgi:hypothetical protein
VFENPVVVHSKKSYQSSNASGTPLSVSNSSLNPDSSFQLLSMSTSFVSQQLPTNTSFDSPSSSSIALPPSSSSSSLLSSFASIKSSFQGNPSQSSGHKNKGSNSLLEIVHLKSCAEYCQQMANIRTVCTVNGWAPLYHYTQPMFGNMIAKTGFRMSTQGQGDGGVYFSTKGPCSYGLGTLDYETNIIVDCFGESRLEEYRGKSMLDLVIIYGAQPQILSPAPGGRDNAVMVRKADFEALAYPHADGNYFLRPDRILGLFVINTATTSPLNGIRFASLKMENEVEKDNSVKLWIHEVQKFIEQNEAVSKSKFNKSQRDNKTTTMIKSKSSSSSRSMKEGHEDDDDDYDDENSAASNQSPTSPSPSSPLVDFGVFGRKLFKASMIPSFDLEKGFDNMKKKRTSMFYSSSQSTSTSTKTHHHHPHHPDQSELDEIDQDTTVQIELSEVHGDRGSGGEKVELDYSSNPIIHNPDKDVNSSSEVV